MKKSFNSYGTSAENLGGSVPVWCGTPTPIPYGGVLDSAYVLENALYKAGTPVQYDAVARTFKPMKSADDKSVTPNGYLLNDVFVGTLGSNDAASGAIVMFHAEGLLINNTEFADIAATLQTQIPNVYLVR